MSGHEPPSDPGAEAMVLGAAMLNPRVIDDIEDQLEPVDFYRPAHETIWRAILALRDDNQPVDAKLVSERLTTDGDIARVGGAPYLLSLIQAVPTVANAGYYAAIVSRLAGLRRLVAAGQRIIQLAEANDDDDLGAVQERASREVREAIGEAKSNSVTWIGESMDEVMSAFEEKPQYTPTPWSDLDDLIGGLAPGRLYVIGARPAVGKSVMGLELATAHALRDHTASMVASLEMSASEVRHRVLSNLAKVSYRSIDRHALTPQDWDAMASVQGVIAQMPLVVHDRPNMRVSDIRRDARILARKRELGLVVVDYLQLMSSPDGRRSRQEVVAEFSRSLKLLAGELRVPVIAISQLNRSSEMRHDKRPSMSDLRESGAVEQDADVIILLHRDLSGDADPTEMEAIVAKNRQGPTGIVELVFQGWYQRIQQKAWSPTHMISGGDPHSD